MSEPTSTRCQTCEPDDASQALAWHSDGPSGTESLIDDSHFMVSISRCPECGQAHLRLFAETIDWVRSEDPQTVVRLAITDTEANEIRACRGTDLESTLQRIGSGRRRAESHWPSDGPRIAVWATGPFAVPIHD